jgi:hypothetical protein
LFQNINILGLNKLSAAINLVIYKQGVSEEDHAYDKYEYTRNKIRGFISDKNIWI